MPIYLTYGLKVDNLRGHELRGAEEDLQLFVGLELARQTEVDDLDLVPHPCHTQDVLGLK